MLSKHRRRCLFTGTLITNHTQRVPLEHKKGNFKYFLMPRDNEWTFELETFVSGYTIGKEEGYRIASLSIAR